MRIYAFTDLHGDIEALNKIKARAQKADMIICAGDVSIFGSELKMLLHELNKIEKPVLIIHGNHETDEEMRHASKGLKNIQVIHRKIYSIGAYKIVGYGGGGKRRQNNTCNTSTAARDSNRQDIPPICRQQIDNRIHQKRTALACNMRPLT
jgi:Icc-related predicted phosphoesterase